MFRPLARVINWNVRNQAYIRRQEKLNAARQEAEKAPGSESLDDMVVPVKEDAEKVSVDETDEFSAVGEAIETNVTFGCELCNYEGSTENELRRSHLARKHVKFSEIEDV